MYEEDKEEQRLLMEKKEKGKGGQFSNLGFHLHELIY